eukprot:GFYU01005003.1.p1 GENE.GFYU01005003.1~~GFYU01005003.1.p1  ORF type:complete len:317 (+),score=48.65 GFYU01005003.1:209-1159(+)
MSARSVCRAVRSSVGVVGALTTPSVSARATRRSVSVPAHLRRLHGGVASHGAPEAFVRHSLARRCNLRSPTACSSVSLTSGYRRLHSRAVNYKATQQVAVGEDITSVDVDTGAATQGSGSTATGGGNVHLFDTTLAKQGLRAWPKRDPETGEFACDAPEVPPTDPGVVDVAQLFKDKTVVVIGIPAIQSFYRSDRTGISFYAACSQDMMPQYVAAQDEFKARGVDAILAVCVGEPFACKIWGQKFKEEDDFFKVMADVYLEFTERCRLFHDERDSVEIRSQRYAMVVKNGTVNAFAAESRPDVVDVTSAERVLNLL